MPPETPSLPMQPVERDANRNMRFVENKIVRVLYDWARARGMGLNELYAVVGHRNPEHMMQFAQLLGYSIHGYHELSYVTDESAAKSADLVKAFVDAERAS